MRKPRLLFILFILIPLLFSVTFSFTSLVSRANAGKKPSNNSAGESQLAGTWKLVSSQVVGANGAMMPDPDYGPGSVGYLIYDNTGHVCVELMNPNRTKWKSDASPTVEEARSTVTSYEAYCGTYAADQKRQTVTHHAEMSMNPNLTGRDLVRHYNVTGDRLTLTLQDTSFDGSVHTFVITWKRVTSSGNVHSVNQKDFASCLPPELKVDDVVTLQGPNNSPVNVAQKLNELGARCSAKGELTNASGQPIYFYRLTGCWGNPPEDYQNILADQRRKLKELEKTYQVIQMTCNPTGAEIR